MTAPTSPERNCSQGCNGCDDCTDYEDGARAEAAPTSPASGALPAGYHTLINTIEVLRECSWVDDDEGERADDLEKLANWIAALASREATEPSPAPLAGDPVALLRLAQKAIQGLICRSLPATDEVLDAHIAATEISDFFGGAALASPQVAPEGFKLVPIEPTRAMLLAACAVEIEDFQGKHTVPDKLEAAELWKVMMVAAPAPVAPTKVFLVATGEVVDGLETYTRHEGAPPPLCDSELLYVAPVAPTPAQPSEDARDAARYRWLRDVGDATWRPFGLRAGYSASKANEAIDAAIALSTPSQEGQQP